LRHDNLLPVLEDVAESKEIVPEKFAVDHPELLWWPRGIDMRSSKPLPLFVCVSRCVIL
jgi:hypothetical protein